LKGQSLVYYLLISLLNVILFLPVIFYPQVVAPLHVILFWLSFRSLVTKKNFKSTWSANLFSAVPIIGELIIMFIFLLSDLNDLANLISVISDHSFFIFIFGVIIFIEFLIGRLIFIKIVTNQSTT